MALHESFGAVPASNAAQASLFRPSDYTAALLFHIRHRASTINLHNVLEIGTGSGVVMASLLALGAKRAAGVDIEPAAVQTTQELLRNDGSHDRARVVQGDMWLPFQGERFDLIVSNLPQFAAEHVDADGRLPSWSAGGLDGRTVVDKFLRGLPDHLAGNGVVFMTHNVFIDLARTQAVLDGSGMQARAMHSASSPHSVQKMATLNPQVLERHTGGSIHRIGRYWFVDFDIVEISWKPDAPRQR
ncbi:MAG TPA: methyltransferase domain-containing protein [Ramlibacter sp.]|nr:methyltransferase domain-containing protein [Ramlibacter sp.]